MKQKGLGLQVQSEWELKKSITLIKIAIASSVNKTMMERSIKTDRHKQANVQKLTICVNF